MKTLTALLLLTATLTAQSFTLTSPAVARGGALPAVYTCDGESASPPIAWSNAPKGTQAFAVTMHHIPGPGDQHVYLVVYDIPSGVTSLAKNSRGVGSFGVNTVNGRPEYAPPCSQGPGPKTYTLTVYALSARVAVQGRVSQGTLSMDALVAAMKGKVLATSAMDVTYARPAQAESPAQARGQGRGPRLPREIEQSLDALKLSGDQQKKVDAIVNQFAEKQRALREDLLRQLKGTLTPDQYSKIEEAFRRPPPPPPGRD